MIGNVWTEITGNRWKYLWRKRISWSSWGSGIWHTNLIPYYWKQYDEMANIGDSYIWTTFVSRIGYLSEMQIGKKVGRLYCGEEGIEGSNY